MKVTINQPYFLPYIGLMEKAKFSDLFIINDFSPISSRRRIHRRVKIMEGFKTPSARYLTEWVYHWDDGKAFLEIPLDNRFYERIKELINSIQHAYARAKSFDYLAGDLFKEMAKKDFETLGEYNYNLILLLLKKLKIETKTVLASKCGLFTVDDLDNLPHDFANRATYVAFQMCKLAGAKTYVSGQSGPKYLDETPFSANKIEVLYQKLDFKPYPQFRFGSEFFVPGLSVIDLIFNCGPEAGSHIGKNSAFYALEK